MDYASILDRIYQAVDEQAYFAPTATVPAEQREAAHEVMAICGATDFDAQAARRLANRHFRDGRIDKVRLLSLLHAIEAHPKVKNYDEAARLVAEQEMAALSEGGPLLPTNLASVERHRGVLAFLKQQHEVALDYFSRALDRERSAINLANILAALLALGETTHATDLVASIQRAYPPALVRQLDGIIASDPDLALLRTETS